MTTILPAFEMPPLVPAAPAPAPAVVPGPAIPQPRMDLVAEKYRALRDKKKEIQARHTAELKPLIDAMDQLEAYLLDALNRTGSNSVKTDAGTIYKSTRVSYSIADPAEFRRFVEVNGLPELFENRPSKEALESYVNDGNPLPPGIKRSSDVTVNIRK